MVTPSTSGKSYQASFAYDASRFGAQVRDAIGSNAQLVQSRTGSIRVWAHVPVVRTDGSVVYRNFRLAPVHGNGGSSSFWSVTPLRKLNASNDAVALRDGISFFSRTTDGDTVWYQAFGDNAKPAP